MWDKGFKIGLPVSILAVAIALFQHSQNSRYQYFNGANQQGIVDTRGEFWTEKDGHPLPTANRENYAHHPSIEDASADDDRTKAFNDCIWKTMRNTKTMCGGIKSSPNYHPSYRALIG